MHHLDTEIAQDVGVNAALIFDGILHRVATNIAHGRNEKDGRFWTYQAVKGLQGIYPYIGVKAIRNALNKLIEKGYIIKGEYNSKSYDRTCWYALGTVGLSHLPKRQMEIAKRANRDAPKGKPIPLSKTLDKKTIPNGIAKKTRRKDDIPLPDDWRPPPLSPDFRAKLTNLTDQDLELEYEQFRNHAAANDRRQRDWDAAWRVWLGKANQWSKPKRTSVGESSRERGARKAREADRAAEAAIRELESEFAGTDYGPFS